MSGADYLGGCQHQARVPCEVCAASRKVFVDILASLPPWPGSRMAGIAAEYAARCRCPPFDPDPDTSDRMRGEPGPHHDRTCSKHTRRP